MPSTLSPSEQSRLDELLASIRDGTKTLSPAQRAVIVSFAEQSNTSQRPNLLTDATFQGAEWVNYQEREDAYILGRALGAGLRDFFSGGSEQTLSDVIPGAANLGGFQSGGPGDISGYIVTVPFERSPTGGRKTIGKVRINIEWDDTLEDVRNKARQVVRKFMGKTDTQFRLLF